MSRGLRVERLRCTYPEVPEPRGVVRPTLEDILGMGMGMAMGMYWSSGVEWSKGIDEVKLRSSDSGEELSWCWWNPSED